MAISLHPHQFVQPQTSQLTLSPPFMPYNSTVKGITCLYEGWGIRLAGARPLTAGQNSKDALVAVALEEERGKVGQLGFLKADQCCRKITTASRNHVKASHHHCCANTHVCLCFQTHDPVQEHFYSQCTLPVTLSINCWKYLNPWFSVHLDKTEAMCYCPSSHLLAVFFLSDYFCVKALQAPARHKPGSSRCRSAPALTGAAKGDQLENHSPDPAPLLQGQGSHVQVRSLALG